MEVWLCVFVHANKQASKWQRDPWQAWPGSCGEWAHAYTLIAVTCVVEPHKINTLYASVYTLVMILVN